MGAAAQGPRLKGQPPGLSHSHRRNGGLTVLRAAQFRAFEPATGMTGSWEVAQGGPRFVSCLSPGFRIPWECRFRFRFSRAGDGRSFAEFSRRSNEKHTGRRIESARCPALYAFPPTRPRKARPAPAPTRKSTQIRPALKGAMQCGPARPSQGGVLGAPTGGTMEFGGRTSRGHGIRCGFGAWMSPSDPWTANAPFRFLRAEFNDPQKRLFPLFPRDGNTRNGAEPSEVSEI
jgi:hypothetical protein